MNRVFITGMGAISPFGSGVDVLVDAIKNNKSAMRNMTAEWQKHLSDLECNVGAPLSEAINKKDIPRTFRRTMGPTAQMAYLAAKEALSASGIPDELKNSGRMGVVFGSTTGSVEAMSDFFKNYFENSSMKNIGSGTFFKIMSHTVAANLAHAFGLSGRMFSTDSSCTSSTQAIGLAFESVRSGIQDAIICGGSDELHPLVSGSFDLVYASSYKYNDRPEMTPRPFDKDRDGTVCGSGAGCLVLESESSARERGANCIAEILGFASFVDPGSMAQSNSDTIARCIESALKDADIDKKQICYANAHATGTLQGDAAEAEGLRKVFGDEAFPVSSLKGYMGHTAGASGVLELSACLRAITEKTLIPTRNLDKPAEDCKGIAHLLQPSPFNGEFFIKNSFGFGGTNAVLILRRC
ncbi:MAG: beta-ketoacyl-[acyl-carrier-protein] synthase family protein [Desulfobacterales bacterium]|nr:beta-ketoacyl-[acyl-carrier-protein] synthase family protein [Desulfobacterales bacterium]